MARFGKGKRNTQNRKRALHARVKGRQNAKRKYLLPKKGLNQTTYETGFFDFLDVFWNNSQGMNIYNLTRQVAKAWDALLPRPKLNKNIILRDYYEEYKALQEAIEKEKKSQEGSEAIEKEKKSQEESEAIEKEKKSQKESEQVKQETAGTEEELKRDMTKRQENTKKGNKRGTDVSSKSDFEEDSEIDAKSSRSRSDIGSRTDDEFDSISTMASGSEEDEMSRSESEGEPRRSRKQKRRVRKYESYGDYLRTKKPNSRQNYNKAEQKSKDNTKSGEKQQSTSNQNEENAQSSKGAQEGVFFPVRNETSFDRIVQADLDNQTELLKKLKICKPYADIPIGSKLLNTEEIKRVESTDSLEIHSQLPPPPQDKSSPKFMVPTNILHVKNLVPGIQSFDLEEIFGIFLNDILMFHILENKYRGEAVVECKTVEGAENIWKQMNGMPYKRLPLVLEFANKEDLLE